MTGTEENTTFDEEMRASLEKAMQMFQEEGVDTLPSIGPYRDPGFLLVYPDETINISCCRIDTEETLLYRYTLFAYDDEPWSFPCFDSPDAFEGIRLLPMLYRAIRSGETSSREPREVQEMYVRTRLPHLQEVLGSLSFESDQIGQPGDFPCLLTEEAGEDLRFSYEAVFPEWEAAILRIEGEEETAFLPEFGALMSKEEFGAVLSHIFFEE